MESIKRDWPIWDMYRSAVMAADMISYPWNPPIVLNQHSIMMTHRGRVGDSVGVRVTGKFHRNRPLYVAVRRGEPVFFPDSGRTATATGVLDYLFGGFAGELGFMCQARVIDQEAPPEDGRTYFCGYQTDDDPGHYRGLYRAKNNSWVCTADGGHVLSSEDENYEFSFDYFIWYPPYDG